jgi:hypothetical protein
MTIITAIARMPIEIFGLFATARCEKAHCIFDNFFQDSIALCCQMSNIFKKVLFSH